MRTHWCIRGRAVDVAALIAAEPRVVCRSRNVLAPSLSALSSPVTCSGDPHARMGASVVGLWALLRCCLNSRFEPPSCRCRADETYQLLAGIITFGERIPELLTTVQVGGC